MPMRALLQRVKGCGVEIDGKVHSAIPGGLLIFLGIRKDDTESDGICIWPNDAAL